MAPINRRPYWNDEYIPGKHHQSWSPNDDYYHIRGGAGGAQLFKFTLLEDMADGLDGAEIGDRAQANIYKMDGTQVEAEHPVENSLDDFSDLVTDSEGLCIKVDDKYWIIHPETKPVFIRFVLTTDMTSTGTGEVESSSDNDIIAPTASVALLNYSDQPAYEGAQGTAVKFGEFWYVIEVNRRPDFYEVALTSESHDWSVDPARGFTADRVTPITYSIVKTVGSFPLSHTHSTLPTLDNTFNMNWKPSDHALVERVDETNYRIVKILRSKCLRFRFVLTADAPTGLTPNLTGTAICPIGTESGQPPSGSLTLKDIYGVAHNAKSGHKGVAAYDWNNDWYFVEDCQHIATRFIGTIQSTLSGSAATISVTPVSALNGILPSGTQTVKNTYSWSDGTTGHKIAVEWNPDLGQWETYQMRCPS